MKPIPLILVFAALTLLLPAESTKTQAWTASDGRMIQAKFIKLDGESVVLEKDGKQFLVAFAKLSPMSVTQAKNNDQSIDPDQSIDLDKPLTIKLEKTVRMEVLLRAKSPPVPGGLFVYFPDPPTTPYQTEVRTVLTKTEAGKKTPVKVINDFSPLRRPVFQVQTSDKNEFEVEARLSFQMWKRRIVNLGRTSEAAVVIPLTSQERQLYTSPSRSHPWKDPAFGEWLKQESLMRQEHESAVRFAHRALLYTSKHMQYSLARTEGATLVENAKLGKGECNLISALYGTILRANGVPCRRVSGRMAYNGATHNKVEVFIDDVGWIPVEPTGAIGSSRADKMGGFKLLANI